MKQLRRQSRHRHSASRHQSGPKPQPAVASFETPVGIVKAEPSDSRDSNRSWIDHLFDPIDAASIAMFRVSFGLLLFYELCTFFAKGWIKSFYLDPTYHFAFFGFDFIRPLPGEGMYLLFGVLAICSALIAVGLFYRLAITLFFLGFSYIFLIDQARYLNHFYLVGLLAFLMIFIPAARGWSLDALIAGRTQNARIPAWSLWLLRAQIEIMLLYAGLVKLNSDWLQGEPLGKWLSLRTDLPLIGPLLADDTVVLMGAWGVPLLHLIGAVMLLFRSTRIYAFVAYCVFHYLNHNFFHTIDIFPWITISATLLFFDPDWPKTAWRNVRRLFPFPKAAAEFRPWPVDPSEKAWSVPAPFGRTMIASLVVGWAIFQALLPMRPWLYPGNSNWHEQGQNFSWRMMLRQKDALVVFYLRDPDTNNQGLVDPRRFLSSRQFYFLAQRPEMIRQFAYYLERVWAERYGTRDLEVRAFTAASLNGRRSQALIDPTRDLTKIGYTFGNSDWILPLTEPMPPKGERWPFDQRKVLLDNINADSAAGPLLRSLSARN